MDYFFRFEHPWLVAVAGSIVIIAYCGRQWWYRPRVYTHSLAGYLKRKGAATRHPFSFILKGLYIGALGILVVLIGKPQLVDSRSNIVVEGIDIMIVLDASGSMDFQDYSDDKRSRFDVAKEEAIRFINKRSNDAIGLVLFGNAALSRCPLTMDKQVITRLIKDTRLGELDPNATMLSTALLTAVNRLKHSETLSKIMIVLTDGEPSPGDIDPQIALDIAKKFGIKIYTVGIGSDKDEVMFHPFMGMVQKPKVNRALLERISHETGGKCFMARNDKDMRSIYDTIDALERTKHESPLYSHYFDIYVPFAILALCLLVLERFLSSLIWFSL